MFGTFGVLIGLVAVAWGGITARDAWWGSASRTWPTVPGTITESRIERHRHHHIDSTFRDDTITEQAKIEYHFEVDDHVFWGARIAYDGALGRLSAREAVARYPYGTEVTVAYDPADPRRCVLEPGFHRSMTTTGLVGSAILLVVAFALFQV